MLTSANLWNNNGLTKTNGGIRPRKSGGFFMPILWGMRTVNILNSGRRPLALVESPTYSYLGSITKTNGVKMNNIVKFNDVDVNLINRNNQFYMASDQIGHALEYSDTRKIAHLYNSHKSEFEPDMTCLIRKGNTRIRIFNREGAWLIGMFARTPKAAEFRKWVLKVLGAVADNLSPTDKPVIVSEHTRALPSPKKEIVLSEKAKQEIGGIMKAVVSAALAESNQPTLFNMSSLAEQSESVKGSSDLFKSLIREVIREEVSPYVLNGGIKHTEPHNGYVTADGLPVANWIVGIMHGATALQSCIDQMQKRQQSAVKLLTPSAKEAA